MISRTTSARAVGTLVRCQVKDNAVKLFITMQLNCLFQRSLVSLLNHGKKNKFLNYLMVLLIADYCMGAKPVRK